MIPWTIKRAARKLVSKYPQNSSAGKKIRPTTAKPSVFLEITMPGIIIAVTPVTPTSENFGTLTLDDLFHEADLDSGAIVVRARVQQFSLGPIFRFGPSTWNDIPGQLQLPKRDGRGRLAELLM